MTVSLFYSLVDLAWLNTVTRRLVFLPRLCYLFHLFSLLNFTARKRMEISDFSSVYSLAFSYCSPFFFSFFDVDSSCTNSVSFFSIASVWHTCTHRCDKTTAKQHQGTHVFFSVFLHNFQPNYRACVSYECSLIRERDPENNITNNSTNNITITLYLR